MIVTPVLLRRFSRNIPLIDRRHRHHRVSVTRKQKYDQSNMFLKSFRLKKLQPYSYNGRPTLELFSELFQLATSIIVPTIN